MEKFNDQFTPEDVENASILIKTKAISKTGTEYPVEIKVSQNGRTECFVNGNRCNLGTDKASLVVSANTFFALTGSELPKEFKSASIALEKPVEILAIQKEMLYQFPLVFHCCQGDFYSPLGLFIGDWPVAWGNNQNPFRNNYLNAVFESSHGFVNGKRLEDKLFDFFQDNPAGEFPELKVEWFDNGLISKIIFPDFRTLEKFVLLAFEKEVKIVKEAKEREAIIFAKAKETNEKQLLSEHSLEVDDPKNENSIINVSVYAMPDGTVKEECISCH
jgi:hypothetical protein